MDHMHVWRLDCKPFVARQTLGLRWLTTVGGLGIVMPVLVIDRTQSRIERPTSVVKEAVPRISAVDTISKAATGLAKGLVMTMNAQST